MRDCTFCTHTHSTWWSGVCRGLLCTEKKTSQSYILDTRDPVTHTYKPPLCLSLCSIEQLLKAVGSLLLTSHLIIPLDSHEILSLSLPVAPSVSFALALIFRFLLCFFYLPFFPTFSVFLILFCFVSFAFKSSRSFMSLNLVLTLQTHQQAHGGRTSPHELGIFLVHACAAVQTTAGAIKINHKWKDLGRKSYYCWEDVEGKVWTQSVCRLPVKHTDRKE